MKKSRITLIALLLVVALFTVPYLVPDFSQSLGNLGSAMSAFSRPTDNTLEMGGWQTIEGTFQMMPYWGRFIAVGENMVILDADLSDHSKVVYSVYIREFLGGQNFKDHKENALIFVVKAGKIEVTDSDNWNSAYAETIGEADYVIQMINVEANLVELANKLQNYARAWIW